MIHPLWHTLRGEPIHSQAGDVIGHRCGTCGAPLSLDAIARIEADDQDRARWRAAETRERAERRAEREAERARRHAIETRTCEREGCTRTARATARSVMDSRSRQWRGSCAD